jgi:hypothetical protein
LHDAYLNQISFMCRSSSPGRWNFLLRADPRASAGKGFVVFTGHGQNDAGGHFHHETLGQLRHVNEPILMHPDIDESTEVRDICDRGGRRSGRKRPLLADIRQTTNSVNRSAPSVICRSPPARTAELSATHHRTLQVNGPHRPMSATFFKT